MDTEEVDILFSRQFVLTKILDPVLLIFLTGTEDSNPDLQRTQVILGGVDEERNGEGFLVG